MKTNEKKLQKVMAAMQADESLLDCFLEMIETAENEKDNLQLGDDAEDAVVSVVQKAGALLLEKWANKKCREVEDHAREDQKVRPHEKKTSAGTLPLGKWK